jgi:hypothetical protein
MPGLLHQRSAVHSAQDAAAGTRETGPWKGLRVTDFVDDASVVPLGTPVVAFDGSLLGEVRDAHRHYLLVGRAGQHGDLEVPAHAILGLIDGHLRVSVNRGAVSEVDDEETLHRPGRD